jgi:P27 family predicted phage terminase small subunit
MGRKAKPTALKRLEHAQKCRINAEEPKYAPAAGEPPAWLDGVACEEWRRVWPQVKNVVTVPDLQILAGYCAAFSRWRAADERIKNGQNLTEETPNGAIQTSPYVSQARNWMNVMVKYASELGFTPAARSKVKAPGAEDDLEKEIFGDGAK